MRKVEVKWTGSKVLRWSADGDWTGGDEVTGRNRGGPFLVKISGELTRR